MDTSRLKIWWLIVLVPLLMGCPFEDEKCFNDWERITTIENLLNISPMKDSFRIGEKVNISVTISDTVYMWNNVISLINETNDFNPTITISRKFEDLNLFDNDLNFTIGKLGKNRNTFHLQYNHDTEKFELQFSVKFHTTGSYSIVANESRVFFGSQKDCNWFEIRTSLNGFEPIGRDIFYEFAVIP